MAVAEFNTVDGYLDQLPDERKEVVNKLRDEINKNIPTGFKETISYGMIGWVVPHDKYPDGYHCDPKLPLPFMSLASQKNHIGIYHMGIYADDQMMEWFVQEYPKYVSNKLNMGKSCIRFTNVKKIPIELIGALAGKMTPDQWVELYEKKYKS